MTRFFNSPLFLGFDHMERVLDELAHVSDEQRYPPFDVERTGEDAYRVTLALAGFAAEDLNIWFEDQKLHVQGAKKSKADDNDVVHKGIATRQFERVFLLAEGMIVKSAHMVNGLLAIDIERPPLEKRAQAITVLTTAPPAITAKTQPALTKAN